MLAHSELSSGPRAAILLIAAAALGTACAIDERDFSERTALCPANEACAAMGGADGALGLTPRGSDPLGVGGGAGADGVASVGGGSGVGGVARVGGAGGSSAPAAGEGGVGGSSLPAAIEGGAGGASSGDMGGSASNAGASSDASACPSELLSNGGFEVGLAPWVAFTTGVDPLTYDAADSTEEGVRPHSGQRLAWLGGVPSEVNRLSQNVSLPATVTRVTLRGALRIQIYTPHSIVDFIRASLVSSGQRIPLFEFDNGDAADDWSELALPPLDVAAYAGQTLNLEIESSIGVGPGTSFFLDDLSLVSECAL